MQAGEIGITRATPRVKRVKYTRITVSVQVIYAPRDRYADRRYQVPRINMKYGMWPRVRISRRVIGN